MRHPKVLVACWALARSERRHGAPTVAQRREGDAAAADPRFVDHGDGLRVEPHQVPVDDGATTVDVTVYRPPGPGPHPAHVLLHGGGFCYGSSRNVDLVAREYAAAGIVVVSVDYRLAPEHQWPVPVEDSYAALLWTVAEAESLDVAPDRLSVGGASAGGCIAASVAQLARDRGGPSLVCQLLEIPVTDMTMRTGRSMVRFGRRHLITSHGLDESYDLYLPDRTDRRRASPLLAADLGGMPPTIIVTCEYDPLRDEGEAYGERLRAAGIPVEVIRARGHVHSSLYSALPSSVRYRARTTALLAAAHGLPATG